MTWQGTTKPTEAPTFGNTAADYAAHRHDFPPPLFDQLAREGLLKPGIHLLDLGTGTGAFARPAAARGARVTGVDIDGEMLAQARIMAAQQGLDVRFEQGPAETLSVGDNSQDVVNAGQCWHWFDRPRAAHEAYRVLRPGGALLITHYDWLPLPGGIAAMTEALVLDYNLAWRGAGGTGIYPAWFADLAAAGFSGIRSFSLDHPTCYSHTGWVGRILACAGVAALSADRREAFRADLTRRLQTQFPEEQLEIPHRIFAVWGYKN